MATQENITMMKMKQKIYNDVRNSVGSQAESALKTRGSGCGGGDFREMQDKNKAWWEGECRGVAGAFGRTRLGPLGGAAIHIQVLMYYVLVLTQK